MGESGPFWNSKVPTTQTLRDIDCLQGWRLCIDIMIARSSVRNTAVADCNYHDKEHSASSCNLAPAPVPLLPFHFLGQAIQNDAGDQSKIAVAEMAVEKTCPDRCV